MRQELIWISCALGSRCDQSACFPAQWLSHRFSCHPIYTCRRSTNKRIYSPVISGSFTYTQVGLSILLFLNGRLEEHFIQLVPLNVRVSLVHACYCSTRTIECGRHPCYTLVIEIHMLVRQSLRPILVASWS